MTDVQGESEIPIWDARPVSTRMRSRGGGRTCSRTATTSKAGEMDETEINALNPEAFERMLHDRWAVSRRDIYVGSVAPPRSLDASQRCRLPSYRPSAASGKAWQGEVAWRRDEVEALIPVNEL